MAADSHRKWRQSRRSDVDGEPTLFWLWVWRQIWPKEPPYWTWPITYLRSLGLEIRHLYMGRRRASKKFGPNYVDWSDWPDWPDWPVFGVGGSERSSSGNRACEIHRSSSPPPPRQPPRRDLAGYSTLASVSELRSSVLDLLACGRGGGDLGEP